MVRLFVAITLPQRIREDLALMGCGVPGAKWVDTAQIHFTLRFIGEVDGNVFRAIAESLEAIEGSPIPLALKGVGHFPPRGRPRILWVGLEQNEALNHLQNKIEHAIRRSGCEPEKRKFFPHITLARLNHADEARVGAFLIEHSLYRSEPFVATEFHLFSSFLQSDGAIHEIEASYPLARRSSTLESSPEGEGA